MIFIKTKKVNNLVNNLIKLLRKSYDYYFDYGILPNYYYLENIFMSIDLEWFKEEYNNLSAAKVKLLNEELKLIDYRLKLDNPLNSLIEIVKKYKEEGLNVLEIITRIKREMLEENYTR